VAVPAAGLRALAQLRQSGFGSGGPIGCARAERPGITWACGQQRPKEPAVPLPDLRRLGEVLDLLLRPDRAAQNAEEAASDAAQTVHERSAIERDVEAMSRGGEDENVR